MESGPAARCRADPEAYFAAGVGPGRARELCGGCSFLDACAAYALERPSLRGVWGGTTQRERQAARRRMAAEREPPGR
ncbi:WhiB family transcriptional regulator [Streptomyces xiangluensis]|uniref:Transcriptional regulator WhiB n=1 Tax=Streptomyces xiangluensis TaxID=2665720 RepID=A0ABV8YRC8_9ACTN